MTSVNIREFFSEKNCVKITEEEKKKVNEMIEEIKKKETPEEVKPELTSKQKAQKKYREKNRAYYNEYQKQFYQNRKNDEEFMEKHRERCRKATSRYFQRLKEALIHYGYEIRPRGRPRSGEPAGSV